MAFWINIYGCQPYPRHSPLSVNQLKNDSYRWAMYMDLSHIHLAVKNVKILMFLSLTSWLIGVVEG